jgi:acetyl-CoA acetyltransferase
MRSADGAEAVIAGAVEVPYVRRPPDGLTTAQLLADAIDRVLIQTGVPAKEVDGLAISSFTLAPDHTADLAWRLGLELSWSMEDTSGGGGAMNMLQHAIHAVESGDAQAIVVVAGGVANAAGGANLFANFNSATRDHLAPIPFHGPNSAFALLTKRHMERHGLTRADYGAVAVAQRRHAELNPSAVYRKPMSISDYLAAPIVADPLCIYDCVPGVTGADAVLVTTIERADSAVRVRALQTTVNAVSQEGDGLQTGLSVIASRLWEQAGVGPPDIDVVTPYDDYPVMVLIQLDDLGFIADGDVGRFVRTQLKPGGLPVNTSGGMLSAGQARGSAGMHHLVEAVTQLRGQADGRQIDGCRLAVATGYGMVLYRYGAAASAVVLERVRTR